MNVIGRYLDLAGVKAATDLDLQRTDGLGNRTGATDGACRAVERGQKPIAKRLDLAASVACEFSLSFGLQY